MLASLRLLFRRLSPEELMARELDTARRSLLESFTMREYADSMVAYNQKRIARLEKTLGEKGQE